MENYEEKYKNLVERAREAKESTRDAGFLKWIEDNFSELRESEDEKIRQALLQCCDDWEKGQAGIMKLEAVQRIRAWLEKQKEHKSNEHSLDYLAGRYVEYSAGKQDALKEQNPSEWSEEDEACKDNLGFMLYYYNNLPNDTREKLADWLKTLKDRMLPQHKQEWSEEDEKMENLIIKTLTSMGTLNLERYHHMNLDKVKKWFKSLHPHTSLKPSDDEINVAANQHEDSAWRRPFYMEMIDGQPNGVKQTVTTHADSFKAGVEWLWNKLQDK